MRHLHVTPQFYCLDRKSTALHTSLVRLVQMQDSILTLDTFSNWVDELSKFNHFPQCTWEKLKALLMKRFQPRVLMAMYKAQSQAHCKNQMEDIYIHVVALYGLPEEKAPPTKSLN